MKKYSIFFMLIALIGCLIQGCTSEDNKDLEYGIRDLPSIGGANPTSGLRKAICAKWLGWTYTVESDGSVEVNCSESLATLFDYRTRSTSVSTAFTNLATNNIDILIVEEPLPDSSDLDMKDYLNRYSNIALKQKTIGYTSAGNAVIAFIRESTPETTEAYKVYEYLSTAAGQAVLQQCGYSVSK